MPDPIEMLTQDHRKVETLFEQYRTEPSPTIVEQICTELTVHTAVEEKDVYPLLGSSIEGGRELRDHAEKEHAEVKQAILGIERAGYGSPEVEAFLQTIMNGVSEHVTEEEAEVFPAMRSQMTDARMAKLGEKAQGTKEKLLLEAEQAGPLIDLTKDELYDMAKAKQIEGRSDMNRQQLISALRSS